MNGWKARAEYIRRKVKKVKTWHLVAALIALGVLSLVFLRINNSGMVVLRDQVIAADEKGNDKELQNAIAKLQHYVSAHMNADTGQIALQNSYDRAVSAAYAAVDNDIDASGYAAATENCKSLRTQGWGAYIACVSSAIDTSTSNFRPPELPNPGLYYVSYASPLVSFDSAGVLTTLAFVVFFIIVFKLLTEVVLQLVLYKRRKIG
jgi:hypothetical protein